MRLRTALKLVFLGAIVLMVALVAAAKSIDMERYRAALAEASKAATGRDLAIRGKVVLKLSLTPAIIAEDVALANVEGGSRPEMVTATRIEAQIGLLALLAREVRIKRLVLIEPDVLLETDAQGKPNWDFGAATGALPDVASTGTPTSFHIAQLKIEKAQLVYRNGVTGLSETLVIDSMSVDADNPVVPVGLTMKGAWNGRPLEISGVLGPLVDLAMAGTPYPVKLKAVLPGFLATIDGKFWRDHPKSDLVMALTLTADAADMGEAARLVGYDLPALGAVRASMLVTGPLMAPSLSQVDVAVGRKDTAAVSLHGNVKTPFNLRGADFRVTAEGDNLAGFNKPLGLMLPAVGPLKLTGRLTDADGGWHLSDIKGTFGHSDLAGQVTLRLSDSRPMLDIRLTSAMIDVDELRSPVMIAANDQPTDGHLFSDQPMPLAALRAVDLAMTWTASHLSGESLSAQQVVLSASLLDGKLTLEPKIDSVADGKLSASLIVDASTDPALVTMSVTADKVGMGDLFKALKVTDAIHDAHADLRLMATGKGNSWRAVMAKLNGEALAISDQAKLDGAYADLAAFDVLKQVMPWTSTEDTDMQCLVGHFTITDGLAKSEALLFDTSRMTVAGQGSVNLATEGLDITLSPKPKEASLMNLAVPLDVSGTLAQPLVSPNKGAIVKGLAGTLGGLTLGPLGGVLPFIDLGASEKNACVVALTQISKVPVQTRGKAIAKPMKDIVKGAAKDAAKDHKQPSGETVAPSGPAAAPSEPPSEPGS